MNLLLIIYDSFTLKDKGTVAVGRSEKDIHLDEGTQVLLRTPQGEQYVLNILEVDRFTKCFNQSTQLGLLFGDQIQPDQILSGTELWC